MRITLDLSHSTWGETLRVQHSLMRLLAAEYPEAHYSMTAENDDPPTPFDIPAHDLSTGKDVDDTNGQPVDTRPLGEILAGALKARNAPPPPAPRDATPAYPEGPDPYAAIKERVSAGIRKLFEAGFTSGEGGPFALPELSGYPLGLYGGATKVPALYDGPYRPGAVDINGNIVSAVDPCVAYASGSVYIDVDQLERAKAAGWAPWLIGPSGTTAVGVCR